MRIQCPNCHHGLEIVPDVSSTEVRCPSCGSQLDLSSSAETVTYRADSRRTIGHFELLEQVGRGHFGNVWRARDTRLKRIVAIKIPRTADLSHADKEFFLREAITAARLRHPNIVSVHEVGHEGDAIFIVSDFIPGITLAEQLRIGPPTCQQAAQWCATVADALEYAHENGVIHRDMKPGNVMLEKDKPYVLDFGLAKHEASDFTITSEGEILGTPAYMSPEQARGESGSADRRSDVYSLGTILYELLTGRKPFQGGSRALMHQILNDEPIPPRKIKKEIPRDLETICLRAMSKNANQRYLTAKEMAEDLRHFLAGEPIRARPVRWYERSWRWAKRNPALAIAGGIVTALTVALALVAANRGEVTATGGPTPIPVSLKVLQRNLKADGSLAPIPSEGDEIPAVDAEVVFWPLDPLDGEPRFAEAVRYRGKSPAQVTLAPGDYLVVARIPDHGFHEVYRRVPERGAQTSGTLRHIRWTLDPSGITTLPQVDVPPDAITKKMVAFKGQNSFVVGSEDIPFSPPFRRKIPPYFLDPTEYTYGDLPSVGPVTGAGKDPRLPVVDVSYDLALYLAEMAGKTVPDEFQYEFAATDEGRQKFPWGDDPAVLETWAFGPVGVVEKDRLPTQPPVLGLYSNVAEWTCTPGLFYPPIVNEKKIPQLSTAMSERIVRGGTMSVADRQPRPAEYSVGPRTRFGFTAKMPRPGLGFRCSRSAKPRLVPEDFGVNVDRSK